ncbi:MAG: DinB family protein [bacterium]|nr:DinB family protein [bacterium]
MTTAERQELIARYAAGFAEVQAALTGFPEDRLTVQPRAGQWSAAEVVHHMADSEMNSAIRLRKLLCEDRAQLQGYDQDHYAVRLRYNERPLEPALLAFRAARATSLQVLNGLDEGDWLRAGTHSERGAYSMEDWLRIYAAHAHQHADQIRRILRELRA